jgi:hypothetical protein
MVNAMTKMLLSAMRSYLVDLMPVPRWAGCSEIVAFACRVLGCGSILAIAVAGTRHAGVIPASQILPFGLLVMTVALPVGNLIKEVAILIGGTAINWLGFEFHRARSTLDGAQINEVYRPDGTWDRYIVETAGTIHEWADLEGGCHREILACSASRDAREPASESSSVGLTQTRS